MTSFAVRRNTVGQLLLVVALMIAGLLAVRASAEAQTQAPPTLRYVCADRAGQLFIVGNRNTCPAGFTLVDFSAGMPAVEACVLPGVYTMRVAGQPLPCTWIEQSVILHGPTETLVCSSHAINYPNRVRLFLADPNGSCRPGYTRMRILPANPVAVNDSYVVGFETTLSVSAPGVLANDSVNGGTVTAFDSVSVNGGAVSVSPDGAFSYTPPADFIGTDSFNYTLSNAGSLSSATVTIVVMHYPLAVNDEIDASGSFNGTVPAPGVLANDQVNGATITAYTAITTAGGSVTLNLDGSFVYVAPVIPVASDTFTYTLTNPVGSSTATVTLNFNEPPTAVNDSYPVDEDTSLTVPVPGVLINDTDPDGDPLSAVLVTDASHGDLTLNADGSFTYIPDANFFGADSFTYRAQDIQASQSNLATVSITVNPVNDNPDAVDDTFTVLEDSGLTTLDVLANDTIAPDTGETLSISFPPNSPSGPGDETNNGTVVFYTTFSNQNGADTFVYIANDGNGGSDTATVSVTVTPVNDAPSFTKGTDQTVVEDTPTTVDGWAADIFAGPADENGQALTFEVVSSSDPSIIPTSGVSIDPANGNLSITPVANAVGGPVTITIRLTDDGGIDNGGDDTSADQTFLVTVTGANDAPTASSQSVSTTEELATTITLTGSDIDGDNLTFAIGTGPTNGSLGAIDPPSCAAGSCSATVIYTPDTNFDGDDSFTFTVSDGSATSAVATVSISVGPVADAPVAVNDSYDTDGVATLSVPAPGVLGNDTDGDGDALTAVLVSDVTSGSLTLNPDGSFSYTADAGTIADSFTYMANDGPADSNVATVTILINAVPVANAQSVSTDEDLPVSITLTASDADDEDLTFAIESGPANGSLGAIGVPDCSAVNTCSATVDYTPDADFNGTDSFTFTVNDGIADSAAATVSITVDPVNDGPTAVDDSYTSAEDSLLTVAVATGVTANDSDPEGDTLTVSAVNGVPANVGTQFTLPSGALLTANSDGSFEWNPNDVYHGLGVGETASDTFDYTVSDGNGGSDTATATITINGVNDNPVTSNQSVSTLEDQPLAITLTGSDPDTNDTLTFSVATGPSNGNLTGTAPNLTYTPDANFNGTDSFTFEVSDGHPGSPATGTITITVNAVNDAPLFTKGPDQTVSEDATAQTETGWATGIAPGPPTATDESGQTLTFNVSNDNTTLFSIQPDVDETTGTLTYTPAPNAFGTATVTVSLSDNGGLANGGDDTSDAQTFTITVNAVNDAPSFTPGAGVTVAEDSAPYSAAWATTISPGPNEAGQTLTFVIDSNSNSALFTAGGQPAIAANGTLAFTLAADAFGTATLSVRLTDDGGTANGGIDTTTAVSLTITVNPANDAPTLAGGTTKSNSATAHLELTVTQNPLYDAVDRANEVTAGSILSARVANDPASAVLATGTELTTTRGGTVIFTATGFRYQPPAGVTGGAADTAAYFICDTGFPAPGLCTQLTLSFNIGGELVWFINGAASNNGDGTMFDPFSSIGNFNTYNAANAALTAGDVVFLYSGTYTNGITLGAGQRLFGQGAPAGTVFHTATGLAAPVTGSAYPSIVGTAPNIDTGAGVYAVTLNAINGHNTLRYLTLGTAAAKAGAGIIGTSFGTLTVGDVSIDTDGQALSLTSGTLTPVTGVNGFSTVNSAGGTNNVALASIATSAAFSFGTGALSGATSNGVSISQQNGTFTFGQTIQNTGSGAQAVSILNRTGGTVTFSGSINPTGGLGDAPTANSRGISIASSAGTYTFSGAQIKIASATLAGVNVTGGSATVEFTGGRLAIVTTTGNGLSATAGTLRVTGANNTISSSGGIALNVSGAIIGTGGLNFVSISATGGSSGIVLSGTGANGLTITGNSAGNCGGLANPVTSPVVADCTGGTISGTTGPGIVLNSATAISITRMRVTGSGDDGIRGTSVNGLVLISSVVQNNGNAVEDRGADFLNLSGNVTITNSTVTGSSESNLRVENTTGTLNSMTVTNSTFSSTSLVTGDDGILLLIDGAGSITASITGSRFVDNKGDHFNAASTASVTGSLTVTFSDNVLSTTNSSVIVGGGITIATGGGAQTTALISNNNIQGAFDDGINVNGGTSSTVSSILDVTISGNTIGNAGVANSGSVSSNTITIAAVGAGTLNALVHGNTLRQWGNGSGIEAVAREGSARLNVTITGNNLSNPGSFPLNGIRVQNGAAAADTTQTCADIGHLTDATKKNNVAGSALAPDAEIRINQRFTTTIELPGYTGGNTDLTALTTYLQARNLNNPTVSLGHNVPSGGGIVNGGASCTQPALP